MSRYLPAIGMLLVSMFLLGAAACSQPSQATPSEAEVEASATVPSEAEPTTSPPTRSASTSDDTRVRSAPTDAESIPAARVNAAVVVAQPRTDSEGIESPRRKLELAEDGAAASLLARMPALHRFHRNSPRGEIAPDTLAQWVRGWTRHFWVLDATLERGSGGESHQMLSSRARSLSRTSFAPRYSANLPVLGQVVDVVDDKLVMRSNADFTEGRRVIVTWPLAPGRAMLRETRAGTRRFDDGSEFRHLGIHGAERVVNDENVLYRGRIVQAQLCPELGSRGVTRYAVELDPLPPVRDVYLRAHPSGANTITATSIPADFERWDHVPHQVRWLAWLLAEGDTEVPADVGSVYRATATAAATEGVANSWLLALPAGHYRLEIDGTPSPMVLEVPEGVGTVEVVWSDLFPTPVEENE